MTYNTAGVGLLDFEVELRLRDRAEVVDPFIGLKWHLLRSGHPPYVEAVRQEILNSPRMRRFLAASDKKGSRRAFERLAAGRSNGEPEGQAEGVQFTDEELDALADQTADDEMLWKQLQAGNTAGGELVAKHLISDLTREDGSPIRVCVRHCGNHKWSDGSPKCPECHKPPASEEWVDQPYSPEIACHIWQMTDKVTQAHRIQAFGEDHQNSQDEEDKPLGEMLLDWVIQECERIEEGQKTIGEELAGN